MSPEQREEVVFEAALQLPADQRAAYLDQTCAGDADLRRRVEVLLGAFERAGGFMKQPATPVSSRTVAISLPPTEKPGDRIGRYKLLEQIGEGGCGVVYMAEQTEPVRRRVALKVIKLGMDTKQVIARFEAERQALALMDHSNIAKVLDAGTTEKGRPYFVMELVKGMRVTDYCDQHHLSTEERLGLFTQVCQAIQHAHQKGIIHRDIKPSNILVTLHDGVPVPKVIDFGIAKATEQPLTEKTVFTAFGQFMGTPAYMSPEQAELSGLDIDTRSDIYALGVLLYELLTGKTPFDAKELLQAGLDEMRRRIREEEPMRPSTRLSTMADADLTEVAQQRHSEPAKLTRFIRGDLDWIVMKCLEKDRTRRYETANGLAADIRRHLENEPVVACPPSAAYRFQKLVRRNKLAFGAMTAVAAALVIGLGIAAWQFVEKSTAYNRAVQAEKKATTEAAKSQQVSKVLQEMLLAAGPSVARGRDATLLREMLDKTSDRVSREINDQPEVQGDIFFTIGKTYQDMGDFPRAITNSLLAVSSYRLAYPGPHTNLALALAHLGRCQSFFANDGDVGKGKSNAALGLQMARECGDTRVLIQCLRDYTRSLHAWSIGMPEQEPSVREAADLSKKLNTDPVQLADIMMDLARFSTNDAECLEILQDAVAAYRQYLPPDHRSLPDALFGLGQQQVTMGHFEEAEKTLREAREGFRKIHGPDHPYQPIVLRFLAEVLLLNGKGDEAETIVRQQVEATPANPSYPDLLRRVIAFRSDWAADDEILNHLKGELKGDFLLWDVADTLIKAGKLAEIEQSYREGLRKQRERSGPQNPNLARRLHQLADLCARQGKSVEAESLYREALGIEQRLLGDESLDAAKSLHSLADILQAKNNLTEAEGLFREELAIRRRLQGDENLDVVESLRGVAWMLQRQGNLPAAEVFVREALAIRKKLGPKDPQVAEIFGNLAGIVESQGRHSEAETLYREAVAIDPESIGLAGPLRVLADLRVNQGKFAEAESLYRQELALRRKFQGKGDSQIGWALCKLASVLRDQGKVTEAEANYREALVEMKNAFGPEGTAVIVTLNTLANMLAKQGRLPEAESLHREAAEAARKLPPGKDRDELLNWSLADLRNVLMQQGKLDEAETSSLDRAGFFARRGRWKEAVANFRQSIESGPEDSFPYFFLSPILLTRGEVEEYRQLRQRMLARFAGTTDPAVADRIAKACLIHPVSGADLSVAAELADTAVAQGQSHDLARWFDLGKGLAEYRRGHFAEAADWAKKALTIEGKPFERDACAYLVLAMAQKQLKHDSAARIALGKAAEIVEGKIPKLGSDDLGDYWVDVIIANLLMREARALIEDQVNTGAERRTESP